ncbi:MAG: chemotaxis protein CheA [bacterium]|jgi:two-component system chemotaxis sensor kinase CheA
MNDRHGSAFRDEAHELLVELEISLLALEEEPDDAESIGRVFRAMHTIKGSGAMFGFDEIAAFTHEVETVFDLVRKGEMAVTKELINLTLAARDRIKAMLDGDGGAEDPGAERANAIIASLRALLPGDDRKAPAAAADPASPRPGPTPEARDGDATFIYRIRFRPPPDVFLRGTDPVGLLDELRRMGECTVVAETDAVPSLDELNPELCYVYWDLLLSTAQKIEAIRDVFIFVEDDSTLTIDIVDAGESSPGDYKKMGEILVERGDLSPEALDAVLGRQKRIGEMLVEAGVTTESKVKSAHLEQQRVKEQREKRQAAESAASIRVPAERLDTLVNLVGELVTVQARFSQTAGTRKDAELSAIAEEVERLTWELRDNAMNIRMLPIGTTFSKFKRLLRDLSAELGKDVELTTEGAETELDKTVIEKLNDPLVHLIRNCIDHGIEMPDVRESLGKPRRGTVHLSAVHSGANVLLRIRDDGAGLDKEAIRAKAVERGMIAPGVELSDKELFGLVLLPGFSTATKVTNVSGRGVGMDVVKRAIEALRGTIEFDSRRGAGTTITVRLPLTLAIIDGLLVNIGEGYFVIPLSAVEECVELTREDAARFHGRDIANVRGRLIPYIRLREQFVVSGDPPSIEQIVITEVDGDRVGLVVDRVIGELQTVIKSLGRVYRDVSGISGSTILGDGTVALILDVPNLVKEAERQEYSLVR